MSWPLVTLDSICDKVDYGLTASAIENDAGPRFLRITDLQNDTVDWNAVPSCNCSAKDVDQYRLRRGDIVFARTGATTGKSYLLEKMPLDSVFASYLIRVRPNSKVDPKFLSFFFKSQKYWQQILVMANGAAQPGVNSSKLKELAIPLPPLPEQKRIAAILDKADSLRRKNQQAIQLADKFLRAVFLNMFGDPVNNPKGFPVGTIRGLIESANYGTSAKASETEGEFPILRMGNITYDGGWDFSDLKYIDLSEREHDKYLVKKGDLLFNRTNSKELVGKTAVYERDEAMAIAGYLIRVRTNEHGNPHYISAYLNSKHGKTTLLNMCKSIVGMANINAQELQDIKILMPPKPLQDKFENLVISTKNKVKTLSLAEHCANQMFSALSQKAFSGDL